MSNCKIHKDSNLYKTGVCKKCKSEYNKNYRLENKDKCLNLTKEWRLQNKSRIDEYLTNNRDRILVINRNYEETRKGRPINVVYNRLRSHNRRILESGRKPKWSNDFFIKEAFELAILREKITGIKYHVDHVIPLKNKTVSGLHAHTNIAVIPAILNIRKQNKLIEVKPF